ncbi:MAG: methylated-DNA--[protein]-cysteine S-methyltransferase [Gemmatimonadetes bacterium]|nr:methylated-DNA--[protein]-cysteine S-methyltransferase [Gemmatimonadota bacterium]
MTQRVEERACAVSERELHAFLDGEVSDVEAVDLAEHVAGCTRCRARAVAERRTRSALAALDAEQAVRWHRFRSPFGTLYTARTARGLARVSWQQPDPEAFEAALAQRFPGLPVLRDRVALEPVEDEMSRYFDRELERFTVDVDLSDLGDFQRSVLQAAARIPFGEVIPYAELARRIDRPRAARAVGNALGANPVAIVVPCHRIVASNGTLGGYTGGVEYKRRLLDVEGRRDLFSEGG